MNGKKLGGFTGAFLRGKFDVTAVAAGGENALAVRVSPPPHPGIANEQSIKGGPGENGGIEVLDGPTFSAAEGWDWIPGIRDRDTGIWQDVTLTATGRTEVGDLNVITTLPKPDRSEADIEIEAPLTNTSNRRDRWRAHGQLRRRKSDKARSSGSGRDVDSAGACGVCRPQSSESATVVAEWVRRSRAAHTEGLVRHRWEGQRGETNRIRHERGKLRAFALRRNRGTCAAWRCCPAVLTMRHCR
jgi:hypothetical protein